MRVPLTVHAPPVCAYCGTYVDIPGVAQLDTTPLDQVRAHHDTAECVAATEPSGIHGPR